MDSYKLYLNGQWVTSQQTSKIADPATGETFAQIATVTQDQVKQSISDAHAALAPWRELPAKARADYLLATAWNVEKRTDEIARAITRENGKPLAQSKGEVAMTVDHLRWFAEECRRAYGRVIPNQVPTKRNLVIKRPIGVVGAIAPWNFPLVLAIRKVAPALAAGCPVILKPASQTPICCVMFASGAEAAKLPKGVFQLIVGPAQMIADEMLANPLVRKITFTGSTEVGQKLIAGAARDVKHLSLELGGHAPVLVFDDADLDKAVEGAMIAKFRNTGNRASPPIASTSSAASTTASSKRLFEKPKTSRSATGWKKESRSDRWSTRKDCRRRWIRSKTPGPKAQRCSPAESGGGARDSSWSRRCWRMCRTRRVACTRKPSPR
jgi:succinate-semialdehyde dehydrogenase/glutarate-semialdehyde dehydrogenase